MNLSLTVDNSQIRNTSMTLGICALIRLRFLRAELGLLIRGGIDYKEERRPNVTAPQLSSLLRELHTLEMGSRSIYQDSFIHGMVKKRVADGSDDRTYSFHFLPG
jgi:hypothetical protein